MSFIPYNIQHADTGVPGEDRWIMLRLLLESEIMLCFISCWRMARFCKRLFSDMWRIHIYEMFEFYAAHTGSSEYNDKFHHWHQGADAGVAIQLEDPKLFYCLVRKGMHNLAMRQVWDGGDIVANIRPHNGVKEVSPRDHFLAEASDKE